MTVTTNFFQQPRLRNNVEMTIDGDLCTVRLRDQVYEIELASETRADSARLLERLREGGRSLEQLAKELPALSGELDRIFRDLDRLGVLTETHAARTTAKPGAQFYRELERFIERAKVKYSGRPLYEGLVAGTTKREQLIGYVLAYYHIVRMCPGLLAPSLSNCESRKTQRILQDFFVSELNHDQMIEKSLAAVGIAQKELDRLVPLPMTFSVCASLGVYARQHPMSFKAALFLFEQPDRDFNAAFEKRCRDVGLPDEFYGPVIEHSAINEEGGHNSITEALFAEVPCISDEEQHVVKRHVGILVESLVLMDHQIVEYYGKAPNPVARIFD